MNAPETAPLPPAFGSFRWLAPICLCTALALVGYGAAVYFSQADQVATAFAGIGGGTFAAGLAATLLALALRVGRWRSILTRQGHRLPRLLNGRIYLAGLALSSTPGKVGETARSLLLQPLGVPWADSFAAFVCDRLADVAGVATMGAAAAALAGNRQPLVEGVALLATAGSLVLAVLLRAPAGQRWRGSQTSWAAHLAAPVVAWAALWRAPVLVLWAGIAVLAYGLQGLAFTAFVAQVHAGLGIAQCLAIFVNATLIGAASMVPGGLGTMDVALVLQLRHAGVTSEAALAAAIATRLCTLWFAWLLGIGALLSFSRRKAAQR